jgi:hypothetical protein
MIDELPGVANDAAWFALFAGRPDDAAVAQATKAVTASGRNDHTLNTLAAVHAARGEIAAAHAALVESIESQPLPPSQHAPSWLVLGRIAAVVGETDSAAAHYRRIIAIAATDENARSVAPLAKRWLAELGVD